MGGGTGTASAREWRTPPLWGLRDSGPYMHDGAMATLLSAVFGGPVSVKATRAEGLGALGRAEGIACLAIVLLEQA